MQMVSERSIAAEPALVWAALMDPEVLRDCVPGCEELTGSPEEGFAAVVVQKVGPVKARFAGTVTLSEVVTGESCTLTGEGKGGAAGFAKGVARLQLEAAEGGTLLRYEVEAKVGGKLAQLGSRIIDGFARKMADAFFARLQQAVEAPDAALETPAEEAATEEGTKKGWFRRLAGKS